MSLLKWLLGRGSGAGGSTLKPTANAYFDSGPGTIWEQEQGGYFDSRAGEVGLFIDYPPSQQGGYFDRV